MTRRCPCGTSLDDTIGHDTERCITLISDITTAVERARALGLPADRAARLVGAIGCEMPPPARIAAVLAALYAWAGAA